MTHTDALRLALRTLSLTQGNQFSARERVLRIKRNIVEHVTTENFVSYPGRIGLDQHGVPSLGDEGSLVCRVKPKDGVRNHASIIGRQLDGAGRYAGAFDNDERSGPVRSGHGIDVARNVSTVVERRGAEESRQGCHFIV